MEISGWKVVFIKNVEDRLFNCENGFIGIYCPGWRTIIRVGQGEKNPLLFNGGGGSW